MKCFGITVAVAVAAAALPLPAQSPSQQETGPSKPEKPGIPTIRFISSFDSPPFSFKKHNVVRGMDVDLAQEIASQLGRRLEWVEMPFDIDAFARALDTGKADAAISSITITPSREAKLAFTEPYAMTSLALVARRDAEWKQEEYDAKLPGWTVGVVAGTTGEKWARSSFLSTVKTYPDSGQLARALSQAKFQDRFCILLDGPILAGVFHRYGHRFRAVERDIDPQTYGIAVKKGNRALLSGLNAAMQALHKRKFFAQLSSKWIPKVKGLSLSRDQDPFEK